MAGVAAVVLAAGESRRFGSPKPLARLGGRTLVERAARLALDARLSPVVVVVGHEAAAVRAALDGMPVLIADNPNYRDGQSTSMHAGLAAVPPGTEAAVFVPVDQPWLRPDVLDALVARLTGPARAVVPVVGGGRRSPVVFHRDAFPLLRRVTGDVGGRAVLDGLGEGLVEVAFDDDAPFRDVDTRADLSGGLTGPAGGSGDPS
jgi:molybdenum cofactor cytidylyltransferase